MKIKKYTDPRIKAQAIAKAITNLGEAAANKARASIELKEETEAALRKMGEIGISGKTALTIITAVCQPLYTCTRCGLDRPEHEMSGEHCLECAMALHRANRSKQFS